MKIKKNQLYVLMIAAAAGAWCVDRFVLGGGLTQPSSATASPLALAARPTPPPVPATPLAIPTITRSLASRFSGITAKGARDAFAAPDPWLAVQNDAAAAAAPLAATLPAPRVFDVAAFRTQHRLTAVLMRGRNSGAAIIDGKMVDVGGSFMGLTLRELTSTSATFTGPAGDVILNSDTAAPRDAAQRPNLLKAIP